MSDRSPEHDRHENNVTVRYWAAAKSAAGLAEEVVDGTTLEEVLDEVVRRRPGDRRFADVVEMCSVLVGEVPVGARDHREVLLPPGSTVELLPPFAGG